MSALLGGLGDLPAGPISGGVGGGGVPAHLVNVVGGGAGGDQRPYIIETMHFYTLPM